MSQGAGSRDCPSCGQSVEAGALFCASCGANLPAGTNCVSCGAALEPGARFCAACGTAQAAAAPAVPPLVAPPPTPFAAPPPPAFAAPPPPAFAAPPPVYQAAGPVPCPNCGTEIRPPAQFCRRCGTSITGEPPVHRSSSAGRGALLGIGAAVLAVGAGAFFLLRGDGGGDSGVGSNPGSGGSGAAGSNSPTAVRAGDVLVADSAQARAELDTLLARTGDKAFHVEYDLVLEEKTSDTSLKTSLILAAASPRFALVLDAGPKGLDLSQFTEDLEDPSGVPEEPLQSIAIITDGTKGWACFKLVGKDGECEESTIEPGDESMDVSSIFDEFLASGSEDELTKGKEIKGRKIAGRNARCYTLERAENTDVTSNLTFTLCVDETEGLPLLMEGKVTAQGNLESAVSDTSSDGLLSGIDIGQDTVDASLSIHATKVEFKASDSDFRPPYKITATN